MAKVGKIIMPATCFCIAPVSLCHRRCNKCCSSFFFLFFLITIEFVQVGTEETTRSWCLFQLSSKEICSWNIVHCSIPFLRHFNIGTISQNLLLPKCLFLPLQAEKSFFFWEVEEFLFLFLCYLLRTTWSTPPEIILQEPEQPLTSLILVIFC